jgi:hypothetical protein
MPDAEPFRSIEDRVESFVDAVGADSPQVERLRAELLAKWDAMARVIKRSALLILAAITGFELLRRGLVGEVSISSIKLARLSFLQPVLVTLSAYLFLRLWQHVRLVDLTSRAYWRLSKRSSSALYDSDLELLTTPHHNPMMESVPAAFLGRRSDSRFEYLSRMLQALLVTAVPLIFWVYAYWQLFLLRSPRDLWTWASLVATVVLIASALASSRDDWAGQLNEQPNDARERFRREIRRASRSPSEPGERPAASG